MAIITILLPIFFVFGVGYIAQRFLKLETKVLSNLALYVLVPFLVFRTFYEQEIDSSYGYLSIYMLGLCFALIVIVSILSRMYRFTESERCGLVLSSAFMNNGNYGTPLILFLFGTVGMETAIVLMVLQQLLMSTLGVYYAAKGSPNHDGFKAALRAVRRMPMVYGAIIGLLFQWLQIPLGTIAGGIDLIADAAIPVIMVTLGMQLRNITVKSIDWRKLSTALSLKLMIAPIIAAGIVLLMPVDTMTKQIMIIMAATPTAANTTMYAIQFHTEPQNVSSATLVSTLSSLVTMPVVIYLATTFV
ncbi:AEC family transporter [Guptibacillus algicola]|uniref:AEC family transporter n=1 Tax=Guptibacillus algicola TaxID=225844 RepID=UPI001CD709AA|nr:AEC family transporter [Alkalihalobacillus algicola]MCA0986595.1 AEC family transporter [Alkalihalobacillus algicola]